MSSAHEIVTIQAGNFANFIGIHWWNIQESSFCYTPDSSIPLDINHAVMFREAVNLHGEVTYTLRLILVDLQDNLTSIRKECPLYRSLTEDDSKPLWDGKVEIIKGEAVKNSFFDEFEKMSNPSINEKYSNGEDLYIRSGKEMIEDAIRRMTEESTVFTEKVSVDVPFPKIFRSAVSDCDFLNQRLNLNQKGISKVSVAASFCNSDSSGDFIESILPQATTLSFKEYVKCTEAT